MSDSEHTEHLFALWKRYQFYVIAFLAMVLTAVIGFTHQHTNFLQSREQANLTLFEILRNTDAQSAVAAYEELKDGDEFPPLAELSSFALASVYFADNQLTAAISVLQETADTAEDPNLTALSVLRLAELMIINQQNDEAVVLLENAVSPAPQIKVLFDERIGDAHFNEGNYEDALEAYQRAATAAADSASFYLPALQIKVGMLFTEINKHSSADASDASEDGDANESENENESGETEINNAAQ